MSAVKRAESASLAADAAFLGFLHGNLGAISNSCGAVGVRSDVRFDLLEESGNSRRLSVVTGSNKLAVAKEVGNNVPVTSHQCGLRSGSDRRDSRMRSRQKPLGGLS